ncbi:MAG: hypothetical protein A3G32_10405 [Deltaproteobacteria bacterium RIFCSPLOWO2_12_FULL_40_28]|nr:MAG: hypothetical protein A3C45_05415 [Deltaproteobacteria bacterium RIFCSPHIGHO2_02_FULL_40_28]OGQ20434.1 MAG: hypothetical protein A3E27_00795 [Deltaproteobacteria bacterium RIFCSPHIGHO2_12_FULL_40_32]OGQ41403.1 MAG: hypothetical protein A3I69_02445 [Deltaproteobacteria bacterium RIFCSPLOWO2_02_FULL_40_36]OGQ55042.1 MAG: hypothetical protein A3G32_10405 [Deltaproteobacteria bacterium RIFCSPLOWO2_12_FULL_40_28]
MKNCIKNRTGKRFITQALFLLFWLVGVQAAQAAYQSSFDVITFEPAVDGGKYVSIYGSQNLKAWQGDLGIYIDYADKPLQFVATGAAVGSQSVVDKLIVADVFGALGMTDWFEIGINIPIIAYNDFFTDDAAALSDNGGGMGDIMMMMKFRLVDIDKHKVGLGFMPFITLPSGDVVRYMGNGSVTGGATIIGDWQIHERFSVSANVGAALRDDVTKHGVRIDDQFIYGVGLNLRMAKNWEAIGEAFGRTTMRDFYSFASETPFEAGGAIRHLFGESGFVADVGGTVGIVDGVGSPRYRIYAGLKWIAPIKDACPECPPPAPPPDPRIKGDKIVIWGKIFFDTDKSIIKPISYPVLDDVIDVMQKNPQLQLVEVQGHCDIRGGHEYNMGLSQRRAEAVRDYLVSKGIEASKLVARGYGLTRPIADNTTKEGMSQNRRVEFVIMQREF